MRWLIGFALLFGVGVWGWNEFRLSRVSKAEPQTLTCEALGRDGPQDNAFIVLTDHLLLTHSYVYESRKDKWTEAWIPAVPRGGEYHQQAAALLQKDGEKADLPPPKDLRVIVKVDKPGGESAIDRLSDADTLRGLVINEVDRLPTKSRELLASSYPGIDLDRCWILEVGREPKSAGVGLAAIAGGLAGMAGLFVVWRKRRAAAAAAQRAAPRTSLRRGGRATASQTDEGRAGGDPPDEGR